MAADSRHLRLLARCYGIQTAYRDNHWHYHRAAPETMLAMLQGLGAPIETPKDVPDALRLYRQHIWQRGVEPVIVAWTGQHTSFELRLPMAHLETSVACRLTLETGQEQHWEQHLHDFPTTHSTDVEGEIYGCKHLVLPSSLPWGYHRLTVDTIGHRWQALVIAAPPSTYASETIKAQRDWGLFLPLYALHSQRSWGAGDLTDLQSFATWVAERGGGIVGTLPILAAFLNAASDHTLDPSPYAPVSRLVWNELYVDVERVPGFATAHTTMPAAASMLRHAPLVDYPRLMTCKRRILEDLAERFFAEPSDARHAALQRFLATHPHVETYASFRAVGEHLRAPWSTWPTAQRDGQIQAGDYHEPHRRYHLFAQWMAHEQLNALSRHCADQDIRLYLDLPLGVHPDGYDVWHEPELFVRGTATGAPPDALAPQGQNWGFPPLNPLAIRQQEYRYCIAYLRQQMRHAGVLRLDHVMGLHRLFAIPQGFESTQGVYLRYAAEELYAILSLESHRHQVTLVGENLGTVPPYVNAAMDRHRLQRMYVVPFETEPDPTQALRPVPAASVASLNTHDLFPFAAYCQGLDIEQRRVRGLLDPDDADRERRERMATIDTLHRFFVHKGLLPEHAKAPAMWLRACLTFLSLSPADIVLINLEDLWGETQPQNVPGTQDGFSNWRRKARYALDEWAQQPEIDEILHAVDTLRRQGHVG
jgi:4-alpha-glucanotransferase